MVPRQEVVNIGDANRPGAPVRDEVKAGYVLAMAKLGLTRVEVGGVLGLSAMEVETYYGAEFAQGKAWCADGVVASLRRMATDLTKPNVGAARLYLQTQQAREAADARALVPVAKPKVRERRSVMGTSKAKPKAPKVKPKPMGLKAQREADAKDAERGTTWDGLL